MKNKKLDLKKKIQQNNLILVLIILGIVAYFASKFFGMQISISNWIYFATFLALLWYAEETRKIREIEQEPIIDLYYRPQTSKHQKYLRLRNSGKGTAYNIKVEKIKAEDSNKEFEFYFADPNLILMYDKEQTLWVQAKDNQNGNASYQIKDQALGVFLSYTRDQAMINKTKIKIVIFYENYLQKRFERQFYFYHSHHLNYDEIYKKEFEVEFVK